MKRITTIGLLVLCMCLPSGSVAADAPMYDIVIKNGRVVDGSGNPWYHADVAIKNGRIVKMGRSIDPALAAKVLDASNLIVTPGFIDVHTHIENDAFTTPTADNFVRQGVTSVITGNCGGSVTDVSGYFEKIQHDGITPNIGTLIGHNSVRRAVMGGNFDRDPSAEEMEKMKSMVATAMKNGALGFSTGLIYVPGTYAKPEEVVALARMAARYGGIYASHIRDEGEQVVKAIDEAIRVGREAQMPVEISHFKIANKKLWGQSAKTLNQVVEARKQGIDVFVDQYPYAASSTNLGVLLPSWALSEGAERVKQRLSDLATREKIKAEMREELKRRSGREDYAHVVVANFRADPSLNGRSIPEVTRGRWDAEKMNVPVVPGSLFDLHQNPSHRAGGDRRMVKLARMKDLKKKDPKLEAQIETILDMVLAGGGQMIYHSMDERDVERIMRAPFTSIGSDSGFIVYGKASPHPRGYGSNTRVLSKYSREKQLFPVEEAVRKMTSLPATVFRIKDRGVLREGAWADVVVFDDEKVADLATFEKPHQYAVGITDVIINGTLVIENAVQNGARPGKILLGAGKSQETPLITSGGPETLRKEAVRK